MSKYILDFESPLKDMEDKIENLKNTSEKTGMDVSSQLDDFNLKLEFLKKSIYTNLTRWQRVQLARHPKRPHSSDFIESLTSDWFEIQINPSILTERE